MVLCNDDVESQRLPAVEDLSLAGFPAPPNRRRTMSSVFGKLFTVSTWGESHGPAVGVVVDGCPPRLPLTETDIQAELDRRRPGQSDIVTPRAEEDRVEILSGVFEGRTTGAPISLLVRNADARPGAYDEMREKFRPSHADFTYQEKYGIRDHRGGGRSSARETIGRVAAGAIARKILALAGPVEIRAFVTQVHDLVAPEAALADFPTLAAVDATAVRCPHPATAAAMIERIKQVRSAGDSVGGVIRCRIRGVPAGLGEPAFDRLEADLGKAMLSLPATKGFEIGSGFAGTRLKGSEHNDEFAPANSPSVGSAKDGGAKAGARSLDVRTATNRSGGVQGGISNGEEIVFNVAFKPTATILQPQKTVDIHGAATELAARGRHDPCVLPRAVPIVEAMAGLVILDHWLRQSALRAFDF
jgi:chorismate synthase